MKKYLILFLLLIPLNVFAYVGAMDDTYFTIDNQTRAPFSVSIASSSSTNVVFQVDYIWTRSVNPILDIPGSYMFISIESNKQIEIHRRYAVGTSCNTSCFSNDDYLQLISSNSGYSYVYYFNVKKWAVSVGTQTDAYQVQDYFTITNKESGTATVYLYGSYADTTNQIPQYINDANTVQQIIIDGQTNTEMIIDNNNENTQQVIDTITGLIDSNYVCNKINNSKAKYNGYLDGTGNFISGNTNRLQVTDFLPLYDGSKIKILSRSSTNNVRLCYYDNNKSFISCSLNNNLTVGNLLNIPSNAQFVRFTIVYEENSPSFDYCNNGNQSNQNAINDVNNSINEMNGNLDSSSVDGFGDFFDDFEDPLPSSVTDILLAPLNLVGSLSNTCSPVSINVLGKSISLPCGTDIFWERQFSNSSKTETVSTFRNIWNILFGGAIIYALLMKLWYVYESLIDPMSEAKIENYKVNNFPKYKSWRNK